MLNDIDQRDAHMAAALLSVVELTVSLCNVRGGLNEAVIPEFCLGSITGDHGFNVLFPGLITALWIMKKIKSMYHVCHCKPQKLQLIKND